MRTKNLYVTVAQINKVLLLGSAFGLVLKMWVRFSGGSWVHSYANSYTFEAVENNLYGKSSMCAMWLLLAFFILNMEKCLLRKRDFLWVCLCIGTFLVWTGLELSGGKLSDILVGNIPTTLCLIPLFFLYADAPGVRESYKFLSLFLTVSFLGITIMSSIDLYTKLGYGVGILSSPAKDSLSAVMMSMWVYLFSDLKTSKRIYYFKIILVVAAMICSIAIVSRSWTIQCFLLLIGFMIVNSESRSQTVTTLKLAAVIGVVLVFISFAFEELVNSILLRVGEDTRTGQFEQFFSQVKPSALLLGKGMKATYKFNGVDYSYFDNQIIFSGFHYGILYFVSLAVFLLRVLRYNLFGGNRNLNGMRLVAVFYILAMGGLSVYFKYDWTITNILPLMFLGTYADDI